MSATFASPMRARASTLHAWPPPPAPGSVTPTDDVRVHLPTITSAPAPLSTKRVKVQAPRPGGPAPTRPPAAALHLIVDDFVEPVDAPARVHGRRPHPVHVVRQMVGELDTRATLSQGAAVCAAVLSGMLRARAVVIHAYDPSTSELRVIGAEGVGAGDLLGATHDVDDDLVAWTVLANGNPMTLLLDGELPRFAPARLRRVGAARSLLAVPVVASSGCVAIVEMIDVDEDLRDLALEACCSAADALLRCHAAHAAHAAAS